MTGRLQTGFSQAESLRTRELKGWLYLSASQLVWTRTCLRGHREVQAGPSHSRCRTDFIWNMSLMVPPLRVSVQFSSVAQSSPTLCDPMDCSTPGLPVHCQIWSLLRLMSIESVMPSNHLILCRPLLLLPSIFPSIKVFSNALTTRGIDIEWAGPHKLLWPM